MSKEELTNKYYKQDLCMDAGRCKLYHAMFTQGQCHYYNEWCELKDKVADLEAKLAESQHESQEFIGKYRYWRGECAELNKQLAEKDTKLHEYIRCALEDYNDNTKEIIELKQQLAEKDKEFNWLHQKFAKYTESNQEKISFAVEQLEKVKEKVICGVMDISNNYWSCFVKDGGQYMTSEDLYDALEQEFIHQIEELKKEIK